MPRVKHQKILIGELLVVPAIACAAGMGAARGDTLLFSTAADFGGSSYAGIQPLSSQQEGWQGFGTYESGGLSPVDSLGDPLTFTPNSLDNTTNNGLGNFDNSGDANTGKSYAGLSSPTGSLVINGYTGSFDTVGTGEMIVDLPGTSTESPASTAFVNALTSGTCLAYDITAPGGGTTASTTYYQTTFETLDSNGGFNTSGRLQVNPGSSTLVHKDTGDDPGSFAIVNGTGDSSYWTVYLPYAFPASYASTLTYLQFVLEVNGGPSPAGNITIDNIRTVSPTWAASGSGLSWNTAGVVTNGVLTVSPNWVGGSGGYGAPNGSGVGATFGDLETGNASVGLDTSQTLGTLTFNTLLYQYTLTPSSTGSATAGNLVMDNTVNSADAAINDVAGGQASTNYTEYVAVPVTLNSTTDVTVTRGTDVLDITGNIGGTGGLTMSGPGLLQLYGTNNYSGGTIVNSGTLLVSSSGSLPANKPVTVNGGQLELANTIAGGNLTLSALTIIGGKVKVDDNVSAGTALGTSNVVLASLSITGNGTLDIGNNRVIIDYSSAATDPIASIEQWIANGFHGLSGPSIISSDIAADDAASGLSYGIGYADGADGVVAGLPSGEIEIVFTLLGDANLDGTVNSEDFSPFSHNLGQSGISWDDGDFNYDGTVNSEDFSSFSHNLGQTASLAAQAGVLDAVNGISLANVPEPTSVGIAAITGIGLLVRRRRSSRQARI
jgi:autotransporter-associated beta strand protein